MPDPCAFEDLELAPDGELANLYRRCPSVQFVRYRDGEYLIREEETGRSVFVVVRGGFVVEQTSTKPPTILACVGCDPESPSIVGEMAYLGDQTRSASVRSSGSTYALVLEPAHVDVLIDTCPGLTRAICQQFAHRLRQADGLLKDFQARFSLDPRQRMVGAGEVLYRIGDPVPELYQLVAGTVSVTGPEGTQDVGPDDLPQGFLNLKDYLCQAGASATATVKAQAFVMTVPNDRREGVVRCYPDLVLGLL